MVLPRGSRHGPAVAEAQPTALPPRARLPQAKGKALVPYNVRRSIRPAATVLTVQLLHGDC